MSMPVEGLLKFAKGLVEAAWVAGGLEKTQRVPK